jgi:serine/threonine protein kinase
MPVTEYFDYQDFRAILMPRAAGGTLSDFHWKAPAAAGTVAYRLCKAVHHLHSLRILHGDIKPANIVLVGPDNDDPTPAIIDFGHATDLTCTAACECRLMTCAFSAPELLALGPHSFPSDVWALAATLYFVVCGRTLIEVADLEQMREAALRLELPFSDDVWRRYPASLQRLLAAMLRADPDKRITISECLEHEFFTEILGREWISKEDAQVAISGKRKLSDELKKGMQDHNSRHK